MEAVLLAGGFGTRLLPLTRNRPKVLVPLLNRPMIEHVIDALPDLADRLLFAVGHMADMIRSHFEGREEREYLFFVEDEPLGTGGAVKNCEDGISGNFLVLNTDGLTSLDVPSLIRFHGEKGGMGSLSLWEVEDPEPYGVVGMNGDGRIREFVEKPKREEAPSHLANAGTYLLKKEVLDLIPSDRFVSIEREIFPKIIPHGFYGLPFTGYYLDAGNLHAYLATQHQLLSVRGRSTMLGDATVNRGCLGKNVCLGRTVELAIHSKVTNSAVLDLSKVEESAIIENSIIGEGCLIGRGAHVVDSILGDGVVVDEGVSLSGARIEPGENVTGVAA
ncbi:MAG: NDP-sugar synthase [Thermoplasmata archaeon]|nr:NDP-sugar synthase [Thermoplasmata archaeon]